MIILTFSSFMLIAILCLQYQSWQASLLSAFVIWGFLVTIITELLSLFNALIFLPLSVIWGLINLILLLGIYKKTISKQHIWSKVHHFYDQLLHLSFFSKLLISGVSLILIATGVTAIVSAPNHSDSMEYHMARIMHWMQNHNVTHYPTHNPFQLYQNPWSEFAMLHWQILSGGDYFANLIQWGSMVLSLVGVSALAKQLGGNVQAQIFAIVFCATIPMGILQSSSTNNDYVLAIWLVCVAYYTLLILQQGSNLLNNCFLGVSIGLAILNKGTAYFYIFPFCLLLAIWGIKNLRWQVWKPIVLVLLIVIGLNLGHYTRNFLLFGSPLGLSTSESNEIFGLPVLISNVLRNLALHADIVRNLQLEQWIKPTTGITTKVLQMIHDGLNLDINDPRITSLKFGKFYTPGLSRYEDNAGNPLHLLIIFVSFFLLILNQRIKNKNLLIIYVLTLITGFLLFCWFLTWSPVRCRLHLPLFVLFSPVVGVILIQSLNFRVTHFLAIILMVLSHPWVLNNASRPLIGKNNIFTTPRMEQYFSTQTHLRQPYTEAVKRIESKSCTNLGVIFEGVSFEYPLWILLEKTQKIFHIQHLNIQNRSAQKLLEIPYKNFKACQVLVIQRKKTHQNLLILNADHQKYKKSDEFGGSHGQGVVTIYEPVIQ